jgi:hypothetical protein
VHFPRDDLERLAIQSETPAGDVTAPRWGRHRYRGSSAAAPVPIGNGKGVSRYRRRNIGGRKAAAECQNAEPYAREN